MSSFHMRYIIFDTETTGVGPDKQAVEVAMLEIDQHLAVLGAVQSLIMPSVPITSEAQAIHGISEQMLLDAGAPTIDEWVADTFCGKLDGEVTLIGHRIGFDRPLFEPIGNAVHTLDTLAWAFELFPDAPNKKLDTLKDYLGLPGGGESHRAMADVLTCHQLLQRILEAKGVALHDLLHTRFIVHYCPWGKHRGERLMNVPRKYREWMLGLPDLEPNLKMSLELLATLDPPPLQLRPAGSKEKRRIVIPRRYQ